MSSSRSEPSGASAPPAPPAPENVTTDVDLHKVWTRVTAELWRRHPGWLERTAGRLLRSPGLARALLTTPSLLMPWLIASAVVLGVGAVATTGTDQPLVGLLAPALAGAGIAYAYGPGVDPAWELSASMAISNRMVLLVRVLGVFGIDALLGLAASAASGTASGITFGWLVPMTAVSAFALAVATVTRSANVGVAAGLAGWAITVLSAQATGGQLRVVVSSSTLVLPYLGFAACCAAVTLYATRSPQRSVIK
jgi:hypothetical protein